MISEPSISKFHSIYNKRFLNFVICYFFHFEKYESSLWFHSWWDDSSVPWLWSAILYHTSPMVFRIIHALKFFIPCIFSFYFFRTHVQSHYRMLAKCCMLPIGGAHFITLGSMNLPECAFNLCCSLQSTMPGLGTTAAYYADISQKTKSSLLLTLGLIQYLRTWQQVHL